MFNLFSKQQNLDADGLKKLIDEVITPVVIGLGMEQKDDYLWYCSGANEIRSGLQYSLLKGDQGTLTWGLCLNYVPLISGNNLRFCRTERSFKFHLFEWTDEYSNSFSGGKMTNGVVAHSDIRGTKEALQNLVKRYTPKIQNWLESVQNTDQIIKCAELQINEAKHYKLHYPNAKYILPFLYAKKHIGDHAIEQFESLDLSYFNNNEEMRDKAHKHLLKLLL